MAVKYKFLAIVLPNHGVRIGVGSPVDQFIYDETNRMNKFYGNYASFVMMAGGNEPAGNQVPYLNDIVDYWKQKDRRKVYTGMSVGGSWPVVPNAEFQVRGGIRGLAWNNQPETMSDYTEALSKFDVPFIAHQNGQYCVFPNFEEIKKYQSIVNYMVSDKFNPQGELTVDVIEDLTLNPRRNQYKIYTKDSPDELKPNSNQNRL